MNKINNPGQSVQPQNSHRCALKDCASVAIAPSQRPNAFQEFLNPIAGLYDHFWANLLLHYEELKYNNDFAGRA